MYPSLFVPIPIISVQSNPGLDVSLCYPTPVSLFTPMSSLTAACTSTFFVGAGPIVLLSVVVSRLSFHCAFPSKTLHFRTHPRTSRFHVLSFLIFKKHLPAPQQYFSFLVLSTPGTTFTLLIHTLRLALVSARISTCLAVTISSRRVLKKNQSQINLSLATR